MHVGGVGKKVQNPACRRQEHRKQSGTLVGRCSHGHSLCAPRKVACACDVPPDTNSPQLGNIRGGTIIPMKDWYYKGNSPRLHHSVLGNLKSLRPSKKDKKPTGKLWPTSLLHSASASTKSSCLRARTLCRHSDALDCSECSWLRDPKTHLEPLNP